ncbi:dockerin type I domain-containing protein [Bythopirellula goksoeyrii]|uniref:Peptidase M10 metallopeptidase domain-containing protein n=1 Tax=Bythopirellula goksoeyrii TaxID=1400387 RepID=A0A5B9Q956_9BACT|nr:dockerin type I domain-containing protein [Bythopirellula goksoeyrii]QEG34105.1 hypothetical protein Pr1d_13770 [Bythopirellula goksoeyrii]
MLRNRVRIRAVYAAILAVSFAPQSEALTIDLQYPSSPLFSTLHDPVAKAAIDAAAFDLSTAVTTSLSAVTTDAYSGSSGGAEITFGFEFKYRDPLSNTDGHIIVPNATISSNVVNLFVGARNLTGNTLGVGSPGLVQLDYSQFSGGGTNPNGLPGAVSIAESKAQAAYKRGSGPVIGTAMGSATLGNVSADIDVDYGLAYGSISFDWDSNNNGVKDTDTQLSTYWHFDHTTAVAAGKNDLYSVALHEMLHTLGIGSSPTWDSKVSGTSWTGSQVQALTGSGANLIVPPTMMDPIGSHAASGLMSRRISDGAQQEVVIDPNITTGQRKSLTELDLAFLRDIGHTTVIPSFPSLPGDFNGDGDVDAGDLTTWRNYYAVNANGDADGDGDTDGRDFLHWQRNYTGTLSIAAVPEPNSLVLLLTLATALISLRRSGGRTISSRFGDHG